MATPYESPPPLVADISSVSEPDELPLSKLRYDERYAILEQFEDFADAVYKSLEELIVNRHSRFYKSVHVLFLAWIIPPIPEIEQLAQVFQNKLHFTTERYDMRYDIPTGEMEELLLLKLEAAVRSHAGADELLIIYYAGHGRLDMDGNTVTWQPTENSPTPDDIDQRQLNWSTIEDRLNNSIAKESDILYIVDSTYKHRNYPTDNAGYPISGGTKGLMGTSQAAGGYLYTRDLIDELQAHFAQLNSISGITLHSRMKDRQAKRQIPGPYHIPRSFLGRYSSVKLASITEDDPRTPTALKYDQSVIICVIQVKFADGDARGDPLWWWEECFDNDDKTVEKGGVRACPLEYVRLLETGKFNERHVPLEYVRLLEAGKLNERHVILALMPSELARKIGKKLKWQTFGEVETLPPKAVLTEEICEAALLKAGFRKAAQP